MASTYTTNLGIEKIGTGEQSGTWGETTNLNFDILDQAINGLVSVTLPAVGSTGSPNTLPITDGAVSNGRNAFIELVDGGDLGGTAYVQLTPNDAEKIAYVRNSLSGGQSVILFQGTYNASNDFELANGKDALLYFNGGGSGAVVAVVQANEVRSGSFQIDNIVLDGNTVDVDGDLDIDVSDGDILLKDDGTTFGGFSLGGTDTDNLVIKSGSTPTAALTFHQGNVGFGTQDEAAYLIDSQSASAGIQARFISTDASASSGPDLKFYKNSASPADGDVISSFFFNANTDDGAGGVSLSDVNYGSIVFNAIETNETNGEAAGFALNLKRGGTSQQYISIVGGTTGDTDNDSITLSTGGTAAITIDNSQATTFSSDITVDAGGSSPLATLVTTGTGGGTQPTFVFHRNTDVLNDNAQIGLIQWKAGTAPNTVAGIYVDHVGTSENAARMEFYTSEGGNFRERMLIDNNGDISFYEDTGATARLFWDASAESLGIGDTTPENKLTIVEGQDNIAVVKARTTAVNGRASYQIGNDAANWFVGIDGGNSDAFTVASAVDGSDKLVITSSGNVGIGTTSPDTDLDISSSTGPTVRIQNSSTGLGDGTTVGKLEMYANDTSSNGTGAMGYLETTSTSSFGNNFKTVLGTPLGGGNNLLALANGSEHIFLNGSGNVGIGTSSPVNVASGYTNLTIDGTGESNRGGVLSLSKNETEIGRLISFGAAGFETLAIQNVQDKSIVFRSTGSDDMTLDASGNLLVGGTDTFPGNGDTNTGFAVQQGGNAAFSADDNRSLFNRNNSDGDILAFHKDGVKFGAIGVQGGDNFFVECTTSNHPGLLMFNQNIIPRYNSDSSDGVVDLGNDGARFQDLYLSGTAIVNTLLSLGTSSTVGRIRTANAISIADDSSITLTASVAGGYLLNVYESGTGSAAVYFINFAGQPVILAQNGSVTFSTSDVDGNYCVIKSTGQHNTTFKNRFGASRNFHISLIGGNPI